MSEVTIKITSMDLELIAQALVEVRKPCDEQDCFSCCNYAEIERRIRMAIKYA